MQYFIKIKNKNYRLIASWCDVLLNFKNWIDWYIIGKKLKIKKINLKLRIFS